MFKKSILVLCIDRDNDLYEKVKISGPVIGRKKNIEAAIKLALADPEDPDTNAIFKAVSTYDELSEQYNVEIATLTGNKQLGFAADKQISEQLERVLSEFHADSCVFISDGASDEEIMPIVRSRIKIDSVKVLVIKQAKELEQTYFVLLEKLKDPYYARLIFGIPALVLLVVSVSTYLNWGWQPLAALLGLYLLAKGLGIEESVSRMFTKFNFSVERMSLIVYLTAVPFFLFSLWIAYEAYLKATSSGLEGVKVTASTLKSMLELFPWALLLVVFGKIMDLMSEKKKFEIPKYGLYAISVTILWFIFSVAVQWVLNIEPPYVYFSDVILATIISVAAAYFSIKVIKKIKVDVISRMRLENKEVLSETGSYVGRIIGVDSKESVIIVESPFGQRFQLPIDAISSIGDRVVVNY